MALSRLHDAHSSTATAGHAGRSTRSERAVDAPRLRRPRLLHRNQPATRFHWCTFQRPKPAHISTPLETRPRADPGGGGRVLHRVQLDGTVRGGAAEGVASAEKQTGSARTARTRPSTRRLPLKQLTPRGLRDRAERILAMPDRRSQRYSKRSVSSAAQVPIWCHSGSKMQISGSKMAISGSKMEPENGSKRTTSLPNDSRSDLRSSCKSAAF